MQKIYMMATSKDESYFPFLKRMKPDDVDIRVNTGTVQLLTEVMMRAKEFGTNQICTTNHRVLQLLLEKDKCSLDDYAGSIIDKMGCEWLILNPLEHLVSVPYGKFLTERYLSKFWKRDKWLDVPEFSWNLFDPAHMGYYLEMAENATFISVDIETLRDHEDKVMTCVGFTIAFVHQLEYEKHYNLPGEVRLITVVVPLYPDFETNPDIQFNLMFVRAMCDTSPGKVLQNGKYDIAYLLRFGCPLRNFAGDTKTLFNSWYSELPKRLDFISSFSLRKWEFWKSENVGIGIQHYRYNAKDCFATALIWINMLLEVPPYAIDNFKHKFPLLFPSILTEHTGIKIDTGQKDIVTAVLKDAQEQARSRLQILVGCKSYNPGSPQQTLRLWSILGCSDIDSTDAIHAAKVADRHPINEIIVDQLKIYRESAKAVGSYGKDFVWLGRCYYALNPDATDTGRNSSTESAFWVGLQIQNIPVAEEPLDLSVKSMFIADYGFKLGECDYAQNETWYQAYTSGDTALCTAIENRSRDFHAHNAEKFFGVPYAEVVRSTGNIDGTWTHKTINKPLRNLSKRPNHGAAYNMTAPVLLDTMGLKKVREAKLLLKLPTHWTPKAVCQHLLNVFDKTYPVVRGANYEAIKNLVESVGILVGPTGWTRRCFSNPKKDKRAMNMYAAHNSQSPAAIVLDKCYLRVFNEIWRVAGQKNFKLGPQIHDSIFFQYREGREDLGQEVARCMDYTLPVKDIFGKTRQLNVPTDLKVGAHRWSEL